jgi:hypothetical protein
MSGVVTMLAPNEGRGISDFKVGGFEEEGSEVIL